MAPHVEGLATSYARAGHEVVVLTRAHPDAPADSVVDGVRILRAEVNFPWIPEEQLITAAASANHQLVQLMGQLRGWQPDVVHAHDWLVAWAGDTLRCLTGAPLVATIHATERGRHQGHLTNRMSHGIEAVEWWLTYQASQVIACSQFMVDEVTGAFSLPLDKIHMVANGVDSAAWRPPAAVTPSPTPLVVSWGRLQYEKGFHTLIGAAARLRDRLPNLQVSIVGRGTYSADLQRLAAERHVTDLVRFEGFVSDNDLKAMLHRCTCAVIPSLYEPFGIVALEALAADAPLVAAASGGLAEVLGGTAAGLLFPPGDEAALADAIYRMATDPGLREASRKAADELVDTRYSWDTIAEQTARIYAIAQRGSV
ncbi:MAG: putative alpha,4-glucosyltransferase [Acidimicrobiia bacterium]|nr:putative alpha,4-glucosyltransferase [Acidimicrobiia bacterium]